MLPATHIVRRLFAEFLGTFALVLVAAGAGMVAAQFPGTVSRTAIVIAPGILVMAVILAAGKVSGAHLNPAVSFAFALRGDFPWHRVPTYIAAQVLGGLAACLVLRGMLTSPVSAGATYPGHGVTTLAAVAMETVLTFLLVTTILGTASGAQNVGVIGAFAVGGVIALAGLWASPVTGASMNPVRSLLPDLVGGDWTAWWVYVVGPFLGATLAVGTAWLLRGPGGGQSGSLAAQGALHPHIRRPGKE